MVKLELISKGDSNSHATERLPEVFFSVGQAVFIANKGSFWQSLLSLSVCAGPIACEVGVFSFQVETTADLQ